MEKKSSKLQICSDFVHAVRFVETKDGFKVCLSGHRLTKSCLAYYCDIILSVLRSECPKYGLKCDWNCLFSDFSFSNLKSWLLVLVKDYVTFIFRDDDEFRAKIRPDLYRLIVDYNRSAPESFVSVRSTLSNIDIEVCTVKDKNGYVLGFVPILDCSDLHAFRSMPDLKSYMDTLYPKTKYKVSFLIH